MIRYVLPESLLEPAPTVEEAYVMGHHCGIHGPNEVNSHFRLFATPEHTKAWEQGKADAAAGK
jgi:hypothetical protein